MTDAAAAAAAAAEEHTVDRGRVTAAGLLVFIPDRKDVHIHA